MAFLFPGNQVEHMNCDLYSIVLDSAFPYNPPPPMNEKDSNIIISELGMQKALLYQLKQFASEGQERGGGHLLEWYSGYTCCTCASK